MKVVLGDGSVISVGGRVVKNVAGYDLCKLFTGSYGTLGIITELNFKLRPTPAAESTLIATGKPAALISFARSIVSAALFPVAVELVSAKFASALGIQVDECALLIRFAGTSKAVRYQMKEALAKHEGVLVESLDDDHKLWRDVAQCSVHRDGNWAWCASMLPSQVERFLSTLEKSTALDDESWQVGLANGRMRMTEQIESNAVAARIEKLNSIAKLCDATIFVEGTDFSAQISEANMKLMRRIKERLDSRAIFVDLD
jgi:FAD/FMN-containing dehydrogenase